MQTYRMITCLALGLTTLMLIVGCGKSSPTRAHEGTPLTVLRHYTGTTGSLPDRGAVVVRRDEEWAALWPNATPPAVDFSKEAVLATFAGTQPTTGYTVTISDVCTADDHLNVYVGIVTPDKDTVTKPTPTTPYDMVVIPTTALQSQPPASAFTKRVDFYPDPKDMPAVVGYQDQWRGVPSRADKADTQVVTNAQDWAKLYTTTLGIAGDVPAVDFTRYYTVAVMIGKKPTSGYSVRFVATDTDKEHLVLLYRISAPKPGERVAPVATSPYAVALIPITEMPLVFRNVEAPIP